MTKLQSIKTLLALAIVIGLTVYFTMKWNVFSPPEQGAEVSRTEAPVLNSFSSPPSEAATSDKLVARFYSCIEKQRIMRDEGFYHGKIDGDRGPLTISAEKKHATLYMDWCAKEVAK